MTTTAAAAVIAGIGGALPPRTVTNDELALTLDTSDAWIRSRTGISSRRRVEPGTGTGDLAAAAGRAALDSAGTRGADLLILATSTPDLRCPATAPEVASRLELAGIGAYDLAAACSGFVYALAAATEAIAAGGVRSVLVIGADTYSTIVDPLDRGVAVLFGDGAGAVLLRRGRADEPGAVLGTDLGSDGSRANLFAIEVGGSRRPDQEGRSSRASRYVAMNGPELYAHAVRRMTASARAALDRAGWAPGDLDAFVAHQANQRILDAVADRLGVRAGRSVSHLGQVGNTAAASVPLALADAVGRGVAPAGGRALLTAFGAGLAWGSAAIRWPDVRPVHVELGRDDANAATGYTDADYTNTAPTYADYSCAARGVR